MVRLKQLLTRNTSQNIIFRGALIFISMESCKFWLSSRTPSSTFLKQPFKDKKYEREQELQNIRDIRNKATGHPIVQGSRNEPKAYNFISRRTLSLQGFQLLTFTEGSISPEVTTVNIQDLIAIQRKILIATMEIIIKKVKEEEIDNEYASDI